MITIQRCSCDVMQWKLLHLHTCITLHYIGKRQAHAKHQTPSTIPYHIPCQNTNTIQLTPIQLAPFIPMSFSCDFPMERFHTSHYNMLMHLAFACQCHSISWIQFQFYFKCAFCFLFSIQNHVNVNLIREWIQPVEWAAALSRFQLRITCFQNIIGHQHKQSSQQMICETELNENSYESTQT